VSVNHKNEIKNEKVINLKRGPK